MKKQDNSAENNGNIVESKEGERVLLSCNTADERSPFLDVSSNSVYNSKEIQLDYLASILVDIYLKTRKQDDNKPKKGSNILPSFDKGTS